MVTLKTKTMTTSPSTTSNQRFANLFPQNFPCDCELCRQISLQCSFAQQKVKQRQQELEEKRRQRQLEEQQQLGSQQHQQPHHQQQHRGGRSQSNKLNKLNKLNQFLKQESRGKTKEKSRRETNESQLSMTSGKNVQLSEPNNWREMLQQDEDYCKTIQVC